MEVEPDAATGNAKRRLKFEKEVISQQEHIKGAKPLRPVKKGANAAIGYAIRRSMRMSMKMWALRRPTAQSWWPRAGFAP